MANFPESELLQGLRGFGSRGPKLETAGLTDADPSRRIAAMLPRTALPLLCALAASLLAPLACARNPAPEPFASAISGGPEAQMSQQDADAVMRALEQAIEVDRAHLSRLITEQPSDAPPLRENPELLAIALRLPRKCFAAGGADGMMPNNAE